MRCCPSSACSPARARATPRRSSPRRPASRSRFLRDARRAVGAPAVEPGQRVLTEEDRDLARNAAVLLQSGLDRDSFLELTRVMSQAMATVAAGFAVDLG